MPYCFSRPSVKFQGQTGQKNKQMGRLRTVTPVRIHWSINHESNPVLLKERVRIPRTPHAGGAAMLWGALPLDGVGSCRPFFTDDLHDTLSWVPASEKPHTFKSCFTHSSQVFFGRPGPFLPGTGLDLTLFISPLERMTCPNHLSRRSRTRAARSHIPSLSCRSLWNDAQSLK